jgi:nucleoside-diphosphate-sugar epimerase
MRAFVTGGSGFVGGRLIPALVERGWEVRGLARSDGAAAKVKALGAEPVMGDLGDREALGRGMEGSAVVFHAAAHVKDWGPRKEFITANVAGTAMCLTQARAVGVPRFIHVSTEAVLLGGPPLVRVDESRPRPDAPFGLYAETKGMAEERVLAANGRDLCTIVMRPRFVWGKGDNAILPKLVASVKSGQFRWIAGGRYLTSTCHVDNVIEGLVLAAERGRPGGIYFLTDGEPVEVRSFFSAMLATQGVDPGERSIPRGLAKAMALASEAAWTVLPFLPGDPPITRTAVRLIGEEVTVDDTRAREELGYRANKSREQGLAELRS